MKPGQPIGTECRRVRYLVQTVVFGDRLGLLIFLASLCLFGLVWRTSFLINDSYTIANGLYALERGSLDMTTAAYGPGLETPGAEYYDGKLFSRNYGVIFAALPLVYALQVVELVADLRIALVTAWCLLVLATILLAGRILNREPRARLWGSIAVLALFAGNVALATPLDPPQYHLLALQIVHMVFAAFVGVFTYRLVAEAHEQRLALMATALVTLGTPLAFWAAVPKRHVVTAAVALAVAFAIARSRDGERPYATPTRALAYALVGLLAWIHSPEALVLMIALVVVDVPTAPSNDARTLAVVAGVFLVSLLPMMATNYAITGNPLIPPRLMRTFSSTAAGASSNSAAGGGSGVGSGGSSTSMWSIPGLVAILGALLKSAIAPLATFFELLLGGVGKFISQPEQVFQAYVRSGYAERAARKASDDPAANLSLLESAPVLAGLLALVPLAWDRRSGALKLRHIASRLSPVDAFVVLLFVGYSLVYVARLPVHAQVTVRYLFPLYPLAVYGLVRLPAVRYSLTGHWRTFAWTYAGAVLVGGQLLLVILVFLAPGRGEVFQLHALFGLATAGLIVPWALGRRSNDNWGRIGAATLALATAAATSFVLFVSLEYYSLGNSHALPMMRALAELVRIL